jgi:cytochrome c-type biogenesis protein CcmE
LISQRDLSLAFRVTGHNENRYAEDTDVITLCQAAIKIEIRKNIDTIVVITFEYNALGRRIGKEYVVNRKTVTKFVIGIVVIGGGIGYFMYQAMQSSWSYYYSVDEFAGGSDAVKNSSLRLAGKVKSGTVSRDMGRMQLSFVLAGTTNELPVNYTGIVPDNFTEGIDVVVEGRLEPSGVFNAQLMMTRCESKYKAKVN